MRNEPPNPNLSEIAQEFGPRVPRDRPRNPELGPPQRNRRTGRTRDWQIGFDNLPITSRVLSHREARPNLASLDSGGSMPLGRLSRALPGSPGEPRPRARRDAHDSASPDGQSVPVPAERRLVGQKATPRSLHPLEAELKRIQTALDALEACPPRWLPEKLLWRALRWFYRVRQRRAGAALEALATRREAPGILATYDFEPEMVHVPAGEFLLGSDPIKDKLGSDHEQPQHILYLPDYYLARTPVTNAQYAAFIQAAQHEPPRHWTDGKPPNGKADHPVVNVTWHDATAYCRWLAELTRKPYRLPTEAEWEKGARGTDGRIYPWGDRWDAARCNTKEQSIEDTTPVRSYRKGASPYGLLDMAGNVWEWTSSLSWDYPYRSDDGREDPISSGSRVLRGGSWLNYYDAARCAYRRGYVPVYHNRVHGFRCCMSFTS